MITASRSCGLDLVGRGVGAGGVAVLGQVGFSGLWSDDRDVGSGLAEPQDRVPELEILIKLLDQHGHALALQVAHHVAPLW